MKSSLLLFLLLPMTLLGQSSTLPHSRQHDADRIVEYFLGKEMVKRYVTFDKLKSKYSDPNTFLFHYHFRHPKFAAKTFVISFALDSAGQFIPSQGTHGLIRIESANDSAWISAREALNICRDEAYRLKKRTLRLAWDSTIVSYDTFQHTKDFRDIVPGDMVWQIDGEVLFRGDRYKGTFEVNVLTGAVSRRFAIPWD